jgi:CRP-like cAMP-binding protein
LLSGLTTRQLAELAEAARWQDLGDGDVVVAAGELVDALLVVATGSLRVDDPAAPRTIGAGQVLDDLAVVAPSPAPAPVVAAEPTRLLRLPRVDFEELVDDVPGLAAAVCRVLGTRARR